MLHARTLKLRASNAFRIKLPISRAEFEKGRPIKRLEEQVLRFLTERRGQAYTIMEIVDELIQPRIEDFPSVMRYGSHLTSVQVVLDNLMGKGEVLGKIIEPGSGRYDTVYFAKA
jgi:hypothetical protein